MTTPAIFINCFEVPGGRDHEFMTMWTTVNTYMRQMPGFISNRLHRATTPDARYRYVNYVQWRSADDWRAAHGEEFRALLAQKPEWRDFKFAGAIYDAIVEHRVDATAS